MTSAAQTEIDAAVLEYIKTSYCNPVAIAEDDATCKKRFTRLLQVLATPPLYSTLRLNTLAKSPQDIHDTVQAHFSQRFKVVKHEDITDALVIEGSGPHQVPQLKEQVIVDLSCGMAVLRGANVYAQGIMAAHPSMQVGDKVSVYTDVKGKCCKGLTKPFDEGPTYFVGNGTAMISRQDLFCGESSPSGLAIEMDEGVYSCPSLSDLPVNLVFPQNLPSIICGHVLDPRPGDQVLDMCAAPGGKTVHIACLMKNQGEVIAFDKSTQKVDKICKNAKNWGISIIKAFVFDGTKAVDKSAASKDTREPPFPPESFDRILLDAPCSALGQRPTIYNKDKLKQVQSFPPLQKRLFAQAVELLRVGGCLVYSTCTITVEENEDLVAWALATYPCLQLAKQSPHLGEPGLLGCKLSPEQRLLVQRFDPSYTETYRNSVNIDTIGFFCAKFTKS